jgi:hypothetical protein
MEFEPSISTKQHSQYAKDAAETVKKYSLLHRLTANAETNCK